jgi:pimeloyl-ACP methyl ester carboxylesterase
LITEDYLLHVKSPLASSFGKEAVIDIHRVRPIYDDNTERDDKQMTTSRQVNPRECRRLNNHAERAVIMLHGRTVDAVAAFDPGIAGYNLQRAIANAGFDTYAINLLGYGFSSRFSMENPCNASSKWDTLLVERNPLHPINQQALLIPNPLSGECGHTDNHYFADSSTNVANLRAVVAHVLQRTHLSKVNLVGWSAGGPVIGMYVAEPANAAIVDRMVFLSPLFVLPQTMPGPDSQPKWSLGISTIDLTKGLFFLPPDPATCPGQVPDGQVEAIWAKQLERDPLGATWGSSDPVRGHVVRWPTTLRWRWNATTAPAVHSPALIVSGMLDRLTPPIWATELYDSLSSTEKVLVRIDCGSHPTFLEGSTNPSGWGGPHVVAQDATLQWLTKGTYNGATKGIFHAHTDNTTGIDPK